MQVKPNQRCSRVEVLPFLSLSKNDWSWMYERASLFTKKEWKREVFCLFYEPHTYRNMHTFLFSFFILDLNRNPMQKQRSCPSPFLSLELAQTHHRQQHQPHHLLHTVIIKKRKDFSDSQILRWEIWWGWGKNKLMCSSEFLGSTSWFMRL